MAKRRSAWPWVLCGFVVAFLTGTLVLAVMIASSAGAGEAPRILLDDEENEQGVFVEIPLEGVIVDAEISGLNPVTWIEKCLEKAAEEEAIAGILLRVNSPGGGIRASDEILRMLREFKAEHRVPMVVWMKDVAASGGYYAAMCSDWIVAHESTITASIGVIWNTLNWQGLMEEKLGLRFGNVKSAAMKDIGSPDRPMTEEERNLIQAFVDESFDRFVSLVVAGRAGKGKTPVTEESVRGLLSTILSGRHALEKGLVDELGGRAEAIAKLKALAGLERVDVVEYARPKSLMDILFGTQVKTDPLAGVLTRLSYLYTEGPALLALWER